MYLENDHAQPFMYVSIVSHVAWLPVSSELSVVVIHQNESARTP
jgi:hypothetical protein